MLGTHPDDVPILQAVLVKAAEIRAERDDIAMHNLATLIANRLGPMIADIVRALARAMSR